MKKYLRQSLTTVIALGVFTGAAKNGGIRGGPQKTAETPNFWGNFSRGRSRLWAMTSNFPQRSWSCCLNFEIVWRVRYVHGLLPQAAADWNPAENGSLSILEDFPHTVGTNVSSRPRITQNRKRGGNRHLRQRNTVRSQMLKFFRALKVLHQRIFGRGLLENEISIQYALM